jgi:hypothetical protein
VQFVRRGQKDGVFRDDLDPFFFTVNSWGAALLYFTARDLLAPAATPHVARDVERFTRTLLQMGNRALVPSRRVDTPALEHPRPSAARARTITRSAH